ncbi:MAG TPA: NAD(P)/FAD-dependent oxidoreductase [Nitrospira sp.]|nr:NAD(P)/FAD-dependent oxidoreductase [Nitrospira sp.]
MDRADLVIVGGGAAGLAAAIAAGQLKGNRRVILLDGAKSLGAKILVSGGGRCNVTHEAVTAADFFGNRRIIKNVLAAWSVQHTLEWFAGMGVELKREATGKLFPTTDKARTVLNALLDRCHGLNVDVQAGRRVHGIERSDGGFTVQSSGGAILAGAVILATGGRSLPKSGSDGSGYALARALGHSVTSTVPALVPLILHERMFHGILSGLSHDATLTTVVGGKPVDVRTGSLLWTHFGVSGPVVMDASRFWTWAREQGDRADVYANLVPSWNPETARRWFMTQASASPRRSLAKTLALVLPERLAEAVCGSVDGDPLMGVAQVPRGVREALVAAITRLPLPVTTDRGWNYAEVTAGGIPLEEVNYRTMESKFVPGLYVIGEILNCDGRIGGFNFQWAWATGYVAGSAAMASCA